MKVLAAAPEALMDPTDPWGTLGAHVVEAKGARGARVARSQVYSTKSHRQPTARPPRRPRARRQFRDVCAGMPLTFRRPRRRGGAAAPSFRSLFSLFSNRNFFDRKTNILGTPLHALSLVGGVRIPCMVDMEGLSARTECAERLRAAVFPQS